MLSNQSVEVSVGVELKIDDLRRICVPENIEITMHAAKRLEQLPYTWVFVETKVYSCCSWKQSGDDMDFNKAA